MSQKASKQSTSKYVGTTGSKQQKLQQRQQTPYHQIAQDTTVDSDIIGKNRLKGTTATMTSPPQLATKAATNQDFSGRPYSPIPPDTSGRQDPLSKAVDIVGGSTNKYEFPVGHMRVLVYKRSVTEIKGMDAIVNAANCKLRNVRGVAKSILTAAGPTMEYECQQHIKKNGDLKYSDLFVSNPGNMACKGIFHAVGPHWIYYPIRKDKCAEVLYRTVYNCFEEIVRRQWTHIALCAISSGTSAVPMELCTAMYMKALEDFAVAYPESPLEVHFICIKQDIVDSMIEAHKKRVMYGQSLGFEEALKYE